MALLSLFHSTLIFCEQKTFMCMQGILLIVHQKKLMAQIVILKVFPAVFVA